MLARDVEACLDLWAETAGGSATLVNLSENHTFRIDLADGGRYVLRVHRPGYQSSLAIESELHWLSSLRQSADIPVPRPLAGRDSALVQTIRSGGADGPRHAVLFAFEEGREPQFDDELAPTFETLGRYAARAHLHAIAFSPEGKFHRPTWDAQAILDPDGPWGNWRTAPHVEGQVAEVLRALDARLRTDLERYGRGPDRFGLIHADMRLANLLDDGAILTLIDFDDCGYGWFVYDFGAAVSFMEASPQVPALKEAWIKGYRTVRPLGEEDVTAMDTMVLLRRMALLAWIGSHSETELARSQADDFAVVTAQLAERYLAS